MQTYMGKLEEKLKELGKPNIYCYENGSLMIFSSYGPVPHQNLPHT